MQHVHFGDLLFTLVSMGFQCLISSPTVNVPYVTTVGVTLQLLSWATLVFNDIGRRNSKEFVSPEERILKKVVNIVNVGVKWFSNKKKSYFQWSSRTY